MCLKIADNVDPDQMPHFVSSELGLQFAQTYLSQILE